jgi:hypothetical protein
MLQGATRVNCDDYLSMLATLPVEELAYGTAREHAAGCRDCDRVTRVVAEREHNMLMAFGDLDSSVPVAQTAASALMRSRRRKVALYYEMGLGIAMVATVLYIVMLRTDPAPLPSSRVSETFQLQCLSPEQAAEVLRPQIQPTALISFRPSSGLGVIKVEASREDIVTARSVLDRYDSPAESQCAVQVTVPKVP